MERQPNDRPSLRFSDEELDFFGDLFTTCRIGEAGVEFESFLRNPEYYLRKYAQGRWSLHPEDPDRGWRWFLRYLGLGPASRIVAE